MRDLVYQLLIGVDPHKASLAVAAIDESKGGLLERAAFPQVGEKAPKLQNIIHLGDALSTARGIWCNRYRKLAVERTGERIMSEASAGGVSRAEMEQRLIERSLQEESFRQRLLDNPKGAIEQELGSRVPEGFEVRVVEENADTIYLVLPSASAVVGEGGELSDEALESVAGGLGYAADDQENFFF